MDIKKIFEKNLIWKNADLKNQISIKKHSENPQNMRNYREGKCVEQKMLEVGKQ